MLVYQFHYQFAQKQSPTRERREIQKQATGEQDQDADSIENAPSYAEQVNNQEHKTPEQEIKDAQSSIRDKALNHVPRKQELTAELRAEIETLKWMWSELSLEQKKELEAIGISEELLTTASASTIIKMLLKDSWDDLQSGNKQKIEEIIFSGNNKKLTGALGTLHSAIHDRLETVRQARTQTEGSMSIDAVATLEAQIRAQPKKLQECTKKNATVQTICTTLGLDQQFIAHLFRKQGRTLNRESLLSWIVTMRSLNARYQWLEPEPSEKIDDLKLGQEILRQEAKVGLTQEYAATEKWYNAQLADLPDTEDTWQTHGMSIAGMQHAKAEAQAVLNRSKELIDTDPQDLSDTFETELDARMQELRTMRNRRWLFEELAEQQQWTEEWAMHKASLWFGADGTSGLRQQLQENETLQAFATRLERDMGVKFELIDQIFEPYYKKSKDSLRTIDPNKRIDVLPPSAIQSINILFGALQDERVAKQLTAHREHVSETGLEQTTAPETKNHVQQELAQGILHTREHIQRTVKGILSTPAFTTEGRICKTLGVQRRLLDRQIRFDKKAIHALELVDNNRDLDIAREELAELSIELKTLKSTETQFRQQQDITINYVPAGSEELRGGNANYNPVTRIITINKDLDPRHQEILKLHELNHDDVHTLKELFPFLAISHYESIKEQLQEQGEEKVGTFMNLLEKRKEAWKIDASKTVEEQEELLAEELFVKLTEYRSWKNAEITDEELVQSGVFSNEDIHLFKFIEENNIDLTQFSAIGNDRAQDSSSIDSIRFAAGDGTDSDGTDADGDTDGQGDEVDEDGDSNGLNQREAARQQAEEETPKVPENVLERTREELENIRRVLVKAKEFSPVYSSTEGFMESISRLDSDYNNLIDWFQRDPNPESKDEFKQDLQQTVHFTGEFEKRLNSMMTESQEEDVFYAPPTGKQGWRAFWDSIGWMSLGDIWKMMKDGWEDVTRIWERRSQSVRNLFGQKLTDWIPDSVYIGGRLKHEFGRRQEESEVEEVGVWEKALENKDAFSVLDMFETARDQDQLKAMIINLTNKGRMDWNNEDFLKAMNAVSNYNMPIDKCLVDEQLRDNWLRKMAGDIWSDKDLFLEWRKKNDETFKSEKDRFTVKVDDLANVGGISKELRKQLTLYTQMKAGTLPDSLRDQINPQYYMEMLHYAMRNGKETMEGKFFYLVKGIEIGLLSVDHLRWISGENGGILNRFPFIDYFYGKNNTLPEIKHLAKRLTESGNAFEPGPKTSYFLQFEVAKNQKVLERTNKGALSGGSNIDHEDIPMITAIGTHTHIDTLARESEGNQKVTVAGWQNAYVGYGSIFKAHSVMAQMDGKGARLSNKDYHQLSQKIAAYVHMDNILTKNGLDNDQMRPSISLDEITNQAGPSGGSRLIREFRDGNNKFIRDLVLRLNEMGAFEWSNVTTEETNDVTLREYLNYDNLNDRRSTAKQQKIMKLTERFQQELSRAMISNPNIVKSFLISNQEHLKEEGAHGAFTLESGTEYVNERKALSTQTLKEVKNHNYSHIHQAAQTPVFLAS